MPIPLTYPGVYVEEVPSGVRTIIGVPTSVAAFVGRSPRGPVDEPKTVFSFGEFASVFGGLDDDYPLTFAVRDFFNNGGGQAVVVRTFKPSTPVAPDPAVPASVTFTVVSLGLMAAEPGTWAQGLTLKVNREGLSDPVSGNDMSLEPGKSLGLGDNRPLFNLQVSIGDQPVENLRNLTCAAGIRNVRTVLQNESSYLRVDPAASFPAANTPGSTFNTGSDVLPNPGTGSDGDELTAASDYFPWPTGNPLPTKAGAYALEKVDIFNLLCLPVAGNASLGSDVISEAAKYCHDRRAMFIVDPPASWTSVDNAIANPITTLSGLVGQNAAIYFPRLNQANPLRSGLVQTFVPCGAIAGIYAATDTTRGVWKAPAGVDAGILGVDSLSEVLSDNENGRLNPLGINCLRTFPVIGTVVWGARTMRGADQLADEYKYVPVRRTALFIEESLYRGTKWVVFEPNDERLWSQIRLNVGAFMFDMFRQGAFQGPSAQEAYFVKCDKESTLQNDIDRGIVNILVGFAPLKPAEFVVIKIQQMAGQIAV